MIRRFTLASAVAVTVGLGGFALGGGFADAPSTPPITVDAVVHADAYNPGLLAKLLNCDGDPSPPAGRVAISTSSTGDRHELCIEGLTARQQDRVLDSTSRSLLHTPTRGRR